ncbi:unnamed protein product [Lactuca saligna]|uniref:Uncharacterized protein n=1 Tax=Lactuca saligna TaxID=75948 RepID=A0AA35YLS7_LACSI|nr:unnamed protein product [Lactuca saligna]
MVTREDITAMGDIRSAQVFVVDFTRLLRQCKVNTKRDKDTRIDEPQVEMFWAGELQWNFWRLMELLQDGKIVKLETCHMMSRIRVRYSNGGRLDITCPMTAWMKEMRELFERVERLITKMSASKRAVLQPIFLSVCQDAAIVMDNMCEWILKTANST